MTWATGYYTEPIPFDAAPADLKYTLESISSVGTVYVGEYGAIVSPSCAS